MDGREAVQKLKKQQFYHINSRSFLINRAKFALISVLNITQKYEMRLLVMYLPAACTLLLTLKATASNTLVLYNVNELVVPHSNYDKYP